ncbi:MAG: hypothetical protein ACOCP8_04145 [archaeon]
MSKNEKKAGVCPACGGTNLNYGSIEPVDNMVIYPFSCEDCGAEGEETYSLSFKSISIVKE